MLRTGKDEWLTVKQVSNITGKSVDAIRMLLHRKKLSNVKKVNNGGQREQWLIHRDTVNLLHNGYVTEAEQDVMHNESITELHNSNVIPLEYHDGKLKEWQQERDNLLQGLMMYRYKFEDLERQVKLLPAPPEAVTKELQEKDAALQRAQEILKKAKESYDQYKVSMQQLKERLAEEERAREAYRIQWELAQAELKKPWWKKLWKK